MNLVHAELLVVLAPALACLVLCGIANQAGLRALLVAWVAAPLRTVLANRDHVNTLLSLATNLVFVGGGVGALYGSNGDAPLDQQLGALFGLLGGLAAVRLSRRAAALARKEAEEEAQSLRDAVREALATHRCHPEAAEAASFSPAAPDALEANMEATG